jgi:hypothetical protein
MSMRVPNLVPPQSGVVRLVVVCPGIAGDLEPELTHDEIERLPEDELFETVSEVWAALGHRNEDATRR